MSEEIETVTPEPTTLVLPFTGEVISSHDTAAVAVALDEIRSLEGKLKDAKRWLTDALMEAASVVGTKTFEVGDVKIALGPDYETTWDVTELIKLLDAGLPEGRYNQLVKAKTEFKVDGSVARQIAAANSRYAEIIDKAKGRKPKSVYAAVTR